MFVDATDEEILETLDILDKISKEKTPKYQLQVLNSYLKPDKNNTLLKQVLSVRYLTEYKIYKNTQFKIKPLSEYNKSLADSISKRVLNYGTSSEFHKLPLVLQRLMKHMFGTSIKISKTDLKEVLRDIKVPKALLPDKVTNKCKRCWSESEDTLCDSCKEVLENATDFCVDSFSVTGVTMEPFDYRFKDWSVSCNAHGEYKFTKLNESLERYNPRLQIQEYTNFIPLLTL